MSVSEQTIERVNYFNGQRLVAADFRTDQEYQIAVRRKLSQVLYSSGIVQGLEVTASLTDKHKVVVAPGVALDFLGREIILADATEVQTSGTQTTNPAAIFGNYVVISYAEQRAQTVQDGCSTPAGKCGGNLAWGAATRIQQAPQLAFTDTYPSPTSGLVVLAQVELLAGCTAGRIESGVRRYAIPAKPPNTRPISLEGEKDIDQRNWKTLYFHIDGGKPSSVTLYLRAAQMSTLYYTELGLHTHQNTIVFDNMPALAAHTHTLGALKTDSQLTPDGVQVTVNTISGAAGDFAVRLWQGATDNTNLTTSHADFRLNGINHSHNIAGGGKTDPSKDIGSTTPSGTLTNKAVGATDIPAHDGQKALTYVNKLSVLYDGQDITSALLNFLAGNNAAWVGVTQLGNGQADSPLVAKGDGSGGTGAIALDQLGLDFSPGQHSLTFKVTDASGGQIQYNLYVG